MPISPESTKHNIDFSYEWESTDGQSLSYPMKFLHTATYGPTIQIFDGSGGTFEFPADMFLEVSTFLTQQGVIRSSISVPRPPVSSSRSPLAPIVKPKNDETPAQRKNPLIPTEPISTLSNVVNQPPATDIDPQEILKQRMEAKAKASAERRLRKNHQTGDE